MHDHRPLGWEPSHGPQPYIAALRSLVDLAPDVQLRLDHGEMCRNGYLSLVTWAGTHEGGVFEAPSYIVGALDAQMRARRFDQYDLDQLDGRWRASPRCAPIAAHPADAATRAIDRWIERARAATARRYARSSRRMPCSRIAAAVHARAAGAEELSGTSDA
jgi:hypothetical protein